MTNYEILSSTIAGIAIIISLIAVFVAGKANNINKNVFKRQGVIDLHMSWNNVNDIDVKNLIGPDIVKAVNALSLTASLWNHDVIEKTILYQTYWGSYKEIYEKLNMITELVPGLNKTGRSLLTAEITKAYKGMEDVDLKSVIQTKI